MGFLKKLQQQIGWVSGDLRKHGVVGRGTLTDVEESTGGPGDAESVPTVTFTVEVTLEGVQPYVATYRQTIQRRFLDQLVQRKDVAVRVNPKGHNEIAIDMDAEFPTTG